MKKKRSAWCALPAMLALVAARTAAAQPTETPLELSWHAPAGCPTEAQVRAEVERLLGGPARGHRLRVVGTVHRLPDPPEGTPPEPEPWYVVLQTTSASGALGERTLHAGSCGALGGASALIVALTFDPDAVTARAPLVLVPDAAPVPVPVPLPVPVPAIGPVPTPVPHPAPVLVRPPAPLGVAPLFGFGTAGVAPDDAPSPVVLGFEFVGSGSAGALPTVALAAGGALSVRRDAFRFSLAGAYFPASTAALDARPSAGGRLRLLAFALAASYVGVLGPVELGPDIGLELGPVWAAGYGVKNPGDALALWVAPFADLALAVPIGAYFAPRLSVGLAIPALRPSFVLDGIGAVHQSAAVVGRLALGLEGRLPL